MNNRVTGRFNEKNVRNSKKRKKPRSKSRTNWSKQRIKRELEKFEEELQEEESQDQSIVKRVNDLKNNNPAMQNKVRKLGRRKSKRSSVKAINQRKGMGVIGRQKKSRGNSRTSKRARKGHKRRISSHLDESEKMGSYEPKMIKSQVRQVYTSRNNDLDYSLQHFGRPVDYQDKPGYTSRHPDYIDQRRRHQLNYLQSSRDIHNNRHLPKRMRQSYEQNYVPDDDHQMREWERMQRINRQRLIDRMNYEAQKESNQRMNFDYRNLNANGPMHLPFE
jgi:hypothetical protein